MISGYFWGVLAAVLVVGIGAVLAYQSIRLTRAPVPHVERVPPLGPHPHPDGPSPHVGPPAPLIEVSGWGRFVGQARLETVDEDGEDEMFILMEDLSYVDRHGRRWTAKNGLKTNGASIPQFLWSVMGSPMTGAYRRAAFVHDQECGEPTATTEEVNKMFYSACRCGGTPDVDARWMYWAVSHFGPSWHFQNGKPVFAMRALSAPEELAMKAREYIRDNNVPLEELTELGPYEMFDENGEPKSR